MLTRVDKVLLMLWLVPLAVGAGAAVNTGGDERMVILFVTGLIALMYVITVISMFRYARRRRAWAEQMAHGEADPDHVEGRIFYPGHGYIDTPRARGRSMITSDAMKLFIVISVAVFFGVTQGEWTFAVLALEFITMLTMGVYLHERETELDPAK
ncbi:hypothetical protein AS188_15720 (plasmid) [Kocuria flava]|uniref:Integral membrane protein n=1 Tax=Kocuria flava TaxID=446860 RepID=A0A0U2P308_9MICC|nr:hypothetical protein [Kocuria flava]ALU41341.1 hypothetical protein AS188_15720 [Kocuria flava]GEO93688.1 hypothetical protein KFL01_29940 [Kocuria flava]